MSRPMPPGVLLAASFLVAAPRAATQDVRLRERVDVQRVVVDVRVLDDSGRAIEGLAPRDFRLKVDGREVLVESVQWIPAGAPASPEVGPEARAGRLVVFFFQKDIDRSRLTGLVRMQREAVRLLDTLGPDDHVAVVRYEKSLRLVLDFTSDRDRLRRVLGDILRLSPAEVRPGPFPSLAEHFDAEAARRAATPERGLQVTAEALGRLPGPKVVVLAGWGLGRFEGSMGVLMERDYEPARQALLDARAAVFCLDVTNADYHSLELGLEQVAEDTGGFYEKTHLFTGRALARLQGALAGYYVLSFEGPPGKPGAHRLDVELAGRKGRVLAKRSYGDGW